MKRIVRFRKRERSRTKAGRKQSKGKSTSEKLKFDQLSTGGEYQLWRSLKGVERQKILVIPSCLRKFSCYTKGRRKSVGRETEREKEEVETLRECSRQVRPPFSRSKEALAKGGGKQWGGRSDLETNRKSCRGSFARKLALYMAQG